MHNSFLKNVFFDFGNIYARTGSSEAMIILVAEAVVSRLREMIDIIK